MRHVGRVAAVHARHADEVRMPAGSAPKPISVQTAGASMRSTNSRNSSDASGGEDASARVDEGPLGFPDHLRGAADLARVAFGVNFVAGQMDGCDTGA